MLRDFLFFGLGMMCMAAFYTLFTLYFNATHNMRFLPNQTKIDGGAGDDTIINISVPDKHTK